jgi:hypothetical protein
MPGSIDRGKRDNEIELAGGIRFPAARNDGVPLQPRR